MRNKLPHITETLNEFSLDILCLTETWLIESDMNIIMAALPKSYSILHVPRKQGTGGGVALVYSRAFSSIRQIDNDLNITSFEFMEVALSLHSQLIRVVVVYRPGHMGTDRIFIEEFGFLIENLLQKSGKLLICGDFNYWVDDPPFKPYSSEFLELIDLNNLHNLVKSPTHISGHILDLIITSIDSDLVNHIEVVPVDSSISDHALLVFTINFLRPSTYTKTITMRNYRNIDEEAISHDIQHFLNAVDSTSLASDHLGIIYNDFFRSIHDHYCPVIEKVIRVRDNAPWYGSSVKSLRRLRRRLEREWRRLRTPSSRSDYVAARRAVVAQVFQCKRGYYRSEIDSCRGNLRRLFSFLNGLLGQRSMHTLPSTGTDVNLSAEFATFFEGKIVRIRDELENGLIRREYSVDLPQRPPPILTLINFHPVVEFDVLRYIREVNKTYCLLDPINVSKIPVAYEKAAPFIASMINQCIAENNFLLSEKHAIIKPLLKRTGLNGDDLANYRPVSNLTYLSKIMERAILDQLLPFLEQNNVIPHLQSAYRRFHSTETGLCKIYNDLVLNTCSGHSSLLVLLDLSAAFDTVDHELLLNDLLDFGVQGDALSLLRSYLTDRDQCVSINKTMSEPWPLRFGVPQGSVLGPILFVIYTSGLASLLELYGVSYHFYADDSQIYVQVTNVAHVKERFSSLLSDIKLWMARRKLKLNEGKTDIMIIKGNLRADLAVEFGSLNFCGIQLEPSDHVKNLGILFDKTLSFRAHINTLVKNCYYHIRNLYAVKSFMDGRSLLLLVNSLVMSRVDYCNSLFIGLPHNTLKKLQSVLNRSARLVFSLSPRIPTTRYLIELHWLPIKARIEFKICLITFKVLKFQEPKYLFELLSPLHNESNLDLRSSDDLYRLLEPRAVGERAFASRSFLYVAPRLFNRLPVPLKQLTCIDTFKKKLKSLLFSRAYDTGNCTVNEDYRT